MTILPSGEQSRKTHPEPNPSQESTSRERTTTSDAPADVLVAALAYLERGFSIVPQRPGEKKPAVRWKEFQERRPTREEVTAWLTSQFPDAGIAVILGPVSNLFVIDVDGPEAHAELVARLGSEPVAPKVLSGSGKPFRYHLFFRHPAVATRAKITPWHPHLEFRGHRGIVILPPSLHKSGARYQWAPGQSLDDLSLPDVPAAVLQALSERAAQDAGQRAAEAVITHAEVTQVQTRARAYLKKLPPAVEGQGGDKQTFTVACHLVIGFALSPVEALPLLREYNERCRPPWTEPDLLRKLEEADRRPDPRGSLLHGAARGTGDPADQHGDDGASGEPFLAVVPDFIQADWAFSRPRLSPKYDNGQLSPGRNRIVGGLRWAIHLAVIYQRSSVVILPDVLLGQLFWGGERKAWPANWRRYLLRQLQMFSGRPGDVIVEVSQRDDAERRQGCPGACALHGGAIRHGHFEVGIRTQRDLVAADNVNDDGEQDEDAWMAHVFLGAAERYGYDAADGSRAYDFTLRTQQTELDDEEYQNLVTRLNRLQSRGQLVSVYLPLRLFGGAPRAGLSFRQRQILLALLRELTRERKSDRPDKAKVITPGKRSTGKVAYAVEDYPGLAAGRHYVGFNGNASKKRRKLGGRGYRLLGAHGWLIRSRYALLHEDQDPWKQVRPFLKDLLQLSADFGLVVAGRHPDTGEWLGLPEMLKQTGTAAGRKWLARCIVRLYSEEDYLGRWRQLLARRMGFSVIPDRDQEQPLVQSGADSPVQLLAYLEKVGISQAAAARELGTSKALFSQYMNGRKSWTKQWRERVVDWIRGREEGKRR